MGKEAALNPCMPGLQGVSEQVGTLGYWAFIALFAIRVGFSGACSTVSTFVAEVSAPLSNECCSLCSSRCGRSA
jgi:hypothetical protein